LLHRFKLTLLKNAQQLTCVPRGSSPISYEKNRAPSASSKTPDVPFKSAGKGSLDMPKPIRSLQGRRNGAAMTFRSAPVLACCCVHDRGVRSVPSRAGFANLINSPRLLRPAQVETGARRCLINGETGTGRN